MTQIGPPMSAINSLLTMLGHPADRMGRDLHSLSGSPAVISTRGGAFRVRLVGSRRTLARSPPSTLLPPTYPYQPPHETAHRRDMFFVVPLTARHHSSKNMSIAVLTTIRL